MGQGLANQSLGFLGDRGAVRYALHAARGSTLIWNVRVDSVVAMGGSQDAFFEDLRACVAKVRGTVEGRFGFGFTEAGGPRPYWLTKPAVRWPERPWDFPARTASSIDAAVETPIGEGVRRTGFPLDNRFFADSGGWLPATGRPAGVKRLKPRGKARSFSR
jgi:hypothetical protein